MEMKQTNAEYRERARALFPGISIAEMAHVVPMADGGAFVEGTVFVPALAEDAKELTDEL